VPAELGNILARTLTSAGTVQQNRDDQVVSQATGRLKEIRQVEKTSIVFVVTETRQVTGKSGTRQDVEDLAVTVSQLGADWRIFDVLPATEGQDGDS
jgi:predicted AlkP superfamily phosphohydrolase/phosphomutase